jgi:hypothetical protein
MQSLMRRFGRAASAENSAFGVSDGHGRATSSPYCAAVRVRRGLAISLFAFVEMEGIETEREMLEGLALASFEATSAESGVQAYIEEHFEDFQRYSELLSPFDRQILTEYYHLGKTQEQLAIVHSLSQPTVVRAIKSAVEALGAVISGKSASKNNRKCRSRLKLHEPDHVGQFSVELDKKDLGSLFSPHATPRCS